ncbi:MAG: hypothetical protein ACRELY_03405 [Polyangiaceae bacterium]
MRGSVLRAYSAGILTAAGILWLASGVEREHTVLGLGLEPAQQTEAVRQLEATVADHPDDARARRDLAQAYLDARSPGLALRAVESSPASVRHAPIVDHVYARALLDEGRTQDALAAEKLVLAACSDEDAREPARYDATQAHDCNTWLLVSATRRSDIMTQLVALGVEDAPAHPEASAVAYMNATRDARLAIK